MPAGDGMQETKQGDTGTQQPEAQLPMLHLPPSSHRVTKLLETTVSLITPPGCAKTLSIKAPNQHSKPSQGEKPIQRWCPQELPALQLTALPHTARPLRPCPASNPYITLKNFPHALPAQIPLMNSGEN